MFKEERLISSETLREFRRPDRWLVTWTLLLLFCTRGLLAEAAADAPAEGVVIATDLEKPGKFVPPEEITFELAPTLDKADSAPKDTTAKPPKRSFLSQPASVGGEQRADPIGLARAASHEPNRFRGFTESAAPVERTPTFELMQRAHALALQAESNEDFTSVIDVCIEGAESASWDAGREYFRRLAAWACNRRGETHLQLDPDASTAVADFERAIKLDPRNWRAAHNRGVSFAARGDLSSALADFTQVIKLHPDHGPAYRNRGEVQFELGRYEDAIRDYTRALARLPEGSELYFLRADAYHRLGKLESALADYDRSLRSDNVDPARLVGRAIVRADLGQYAAAIDDLDRAIKTDPQFAEAYRAVAWILATCPDPKYRRPEKALIAARHALELQGQTDPLYYDTLAAAYAASRRFEQAAAIQQHAVRLASGQQQEEPLRTRLALYSQSQPFVSRTVQRPRAEPPAPRGHDPAGLRQPLRMDAAPR